MAWLEKRCDCFRIKFCFGGSNFQHSLKHVSEREAQGLLDPLEDNLLSLLERGKLDPPADALQAYIDADPKKARVAPSVPPQSKKEVGTHCLCRLYRRPPK